MSRALVCDQCGVSLVLNSRGESPDGDDAAWIKLSIANQSFDLCTRSCVVALLDEPEVIALHDEYTETITGIASLIEEGRADS